MAAALAAAPAGLILVAPCDLVRLDTASVERMVAKGEPCVAGNSAGVHPLLAVLPTSWAHRAALLARDGARSAELVAALPRVNVFEGALQDCNRPEDLVMIRRCNP